MGRIKKICIFIITFSFLLPVEFVCGSEKWIPLNGADYQYIIQERYTLNDIYFSDMNNGWIVGRGFGDERLILHTPDGGITWNRQSRRGPLAQFVYSHNGAHFIDSQNGWVVGDKGFILHTSSGGLEWENQHSGVESLNLRGAKISVDLFGVHFTDKNNGWAVGAFGTISHTENGGLIWGKQNSGTKKILWDIHCTDKYNCWAVGDGGTIIHTSNGGEKRFVFFKGWKKQISGTLANLRGVHFLDKKRGWVVGEGGISHTSDGGKTWQKQAVFKKIILREVFFVNNLKGWAVGTDLKNRTGAIKFTNDGGKTWHSQSSGTIYDLTSVHFIDEDTGFIVGEHGTILKYTQKKLK